MELVAPRSSPMRQRREQLANGAASHEDPPYIYLLEHPLWRFTSSVEAVVASGKCSGGFHGERMPRCRQAERWRQSGEDGWHAGGGVWKVGGAVEAEVQ